MALVLLLFLILFSTHSHYWAASELGLGIAGLLVLLAFITRDSDFFRMHPVIDYSIILIGMSCLAFAHPLMLFPISFSLGFFWMANPAFRRRIVVAGSVYILALTIKFVFFKEPYEHGSFGGLKNIVRLFPNYLFLFSNKQFVKHCLGIYLFIPVSSLWILWVYRQNVYKWKRYLFLTFMIGYLLLINISYPYENTQSFYIENLYLVLGVFMAFPIVYDLLPVNTLRNWIFPITGIFFFICFIRIWNDHAFYTSHINWERGLIQQVGNQKVILESRNLPSDSMVFSWSVPYETWFLSTLEQGRTASIAVHDKYETLNVDSVTDPKRFIANWISYKYAVLKPPYFLFKDSISQYQWILK